MNAVWNIPRCMRGKLDSGENVVNMMGLCKLLQTMRPC